jgi:NADH-ubiquinone oxidoreductase chain 2
MLEFLILTLTSFFPYNIINESPSTILSQNIVKEASLNTKDQLETASLETTQAINIKEFLQTKRDHFSIIEYPLITIFILIGGITLLSSNDLITIFLSLELQSYGLYILSTIYRNSESSTSAGLTYFLLGGLSSCIILLGQSLLYVNLGNTNLDGIYIIHNIFNSDPSLLTFFLAETMPQGISGYYVPFSSILSIHFYQYSIQLAFIIIAIGFLFKISASPFHSWSPGVYDAIPTVTTTFVAIIAKISIFILLFDLVYSTGYTTLDYSWTNVLLFSSFLSLIIGSVLGLSQFRIKRLYAYSTISHVGFILLALSIHSVESVQAFFFYIIQYSLSNLNAFIILVVIGYSYVNYVEKKNNYKLLLESNTKSIEISNVEQKISSESKNSNIEVSPYISNKLATQSLLHDYKEKINNLSPIEYIDQLKGYFYLNPVLAISLSVTLYSFIGIPPLVGFFAKQMILSSALDNGYIFMCLIAILTSVISAVYYLYIIKHMFFEKSEYVLNKGLNSIIKDQLTKVFGKEEIKNITLSSWLTCIISILSLTMLLFIFLYHETYFLMNIISILIIY